MSIPTHVLPGYRRDIDGLRAVAILGVVIFHAFPALLTGGFTGVDVFFVISGFLISGIVFRDQERGRFTFRDFYARRIKRIFPALLVMLAVCLVAGWFFMFPDEYELLGGHTVKGLLFVQNISLSHKVGYFSPRAQLAPLLHLWSLCVEEQFYLIWPVLVILFMKRLPRAMMAVIIGLIVVSFTINMMTVETKPLQAFFLPMQRFWELLAGALLAYIAFRRGHMITSQARILANSVSVVGLVLIVVGFALISEKQFFPGWRALAPVVGACLLIAAGQDTIINRFVLGHKAMVFIGLVSYPLYIWHWPILTFLRLSQGEILSTATASIALAVSFILAIATYMLLEKKVRFVWPTRRTVSVLVAAAVILCGFGALAQSRVIPLRLALFGGERLIQAQRDWISLDNINFMRTSDFGLYELKGDLDRSVLIMGDSHAEQYLPRYKDMYKDGGKNLPTLLFATSGGCAPLPDLNQIDPGFGCPAFYDYTMDVARRADVKAVAVVAYWEGYVGLSDQASTESRHRLYHIKDQKRSEITMNNPKLQTSLDRFASDLADLKKQGKKVYIILSNPTGHEFDPRAMVQRFDLQLSPVAIPQQCFTDRVKPVMERLRDVAKKSGATIIDPIDFLCDGTSCPTRTPDGRPANKDSNHIRPFYAIEECGFLDVILKP